MLKIHFGEIANEIKAPRKYFDLVMKPEWFEDEFVKQMVKDVDKTEVVSAYQMTSSVLGPINSTIISGGVKNLILAYEMDRPIDASNCGDNCANGF